MVFHEITIGKTLHWSISRSCLLLLSALARKFELIPTEQKYSGTQNYTLLILPQKFSLVPLKPFKIEIVLKMVLLSCLDKKKRFFRTCFHSTFKQAILDSCFFIFSLDPSFLMYDLRIFTRRLAVKSAVLFYFQWHVLRLPLNVLVSQVKPLSIVLVWANSWG